MEAPAEKDVPDDPVGNAHDEFLSGDYDKCLSILDELEKDSGGADTKLRHNRAVVQFYKTGQTEYQDLFRELGEVEEMTFESDPEAGASSSINPIARYNRALVCYHRRCYQTAIDLLMPLLAKLDALDETAALAINLMLRLLIATNQLQRALSFLDGLMKRFGVTMQEALGAEENMLPQHLTSIPGFSKTFKQLLFLANVLSGKEVDIPEDGTPATVVLKAHRFYLRKDFQMAAKELQKIVDVNQTDCELNTIVANNMGVIHMRVRHYALAAKFFQNAITFDRITGDDVKTLQLQQLGRLRSGEIMYNLGLSMLYLRRPQEAFQCLLVPLKKYHNNPRLWYRLSEACIMHHDMTANAQDEKSTTTPPPSSPQPQVSVNTNTTVSFETPQISLEFGAICLRNALTLTKYYISVYYSRETESESAEGGSSTSPAGDTEENWRTMRDNNFANPSAPVTRDDLGQLLQGIHAALSYVSLRLGDFVTALEQAELLMHSKGISDTHKLLARMYAGEALFMMDKVEQAQPHLDPSFVMTLSELDFQTNEWEVKSLDAAQNIVRYNLAMAMCKQGDIDAAIALLNSCTHLIVARKIKAFRRFLNAKFGKCT